MPIQTMSAILSKISYARDGHRYIADPLTPISVPRGLKERGPVSIILEMPPTFCTVVLWGGHEGQEYTFTWAFRRPVHE